MLELIVTVVITASSIAMFGYWFRYTCLLILSATSTRDYAVDVASAHQLSFLQVQSELRENPADLDRLKASLDRDLAVVTRLSEWGLEERMLKLNYRVMSAWCSATKEFSMETAQGAVDEMSRIISHLANSVGERAAVGAAA